MGLNIGFDVDGVIADLPKDLCNKLRTNGLEVWPEDVHHWDLGRTFGIARKMAENVMRATGFARHMSIDWAGDLAASRARRMPGVDAVLAITAPMSGSDTWLQGRKLWLNDRGFDDQDILFVAGARKHLVAVDVLVEDHAANLARWCEANPNGQGFLIDRPWNQPTSDCYAEHKRMVRCTLEELPGYLELLGAAECTE